MNPIVQVPQTDQYKYTSRTKKQGLPVGVADFWPLVANGETISQLFQRLLTSRQLFSTTFISVHIFLTLLTRRAVTSRAAICQERAWAAQPHKSTQAAKLSYKGTFRQRKLSTLHQAMFYTQKLLRKAALTQRSYYTEQAPKPDLDTQTEKTRFRSI